MFEGKLSVLIAPPRAGKSTFSNKWKKDNDNRIVLCIDDFRRALTGCRYNSFSESSVLSNVEVAAKSFLFGGYEVLIDDTNTTIDNWVRWLRIDIDTRFIVLWDDLQDDKFDSQKYWLRIEECQERAKLTFQSDLKGPINRIAGNLAEILPNFTKILTQIREDLSVHHKYCITEPKAQKLII